MTVLDDLALELGLDVDELRDRLTAPPPDSITPNYLTQDAQGHVGADFSGHVHGSGFDLDIASSAGPIIVGATPDIHALSWLATTPDRVTLAGLYSIITGLLPGRTELHAAVLDKGSGTTTDVTVIDSAGDSSFLQIIAGAPLGKHSINFGSITVTWSGGTVQSSTAVVNHGFNQPGVLVFAQCQDQANVGPHHTWIVGVSNTQIQFIVNTDGFQPPAGTTRNVAWLAIT